DRTGAIEEYKGFFKISGACAIQLNAHLAGARLGARIADRVLLRHCALALDRTGNSQDGLEQRGFSAAIGSYQGHCAWPTSSVPFWHSRLHHPETIGVRGAAGASFTHAMGGVTRPAQIKCSRRFVAAARA